MAKKDIISEGAQKGFMPITTTGIDGGKSFKRRSNGAIKRAAKRWLYRKNGSIQVGYV